MKIINLALAATFAFGAFASPIAEPATSGNPSIALRSVLEDRATCVATSDCSWGYAGKCEQFCRVLGYKFKKMEKCDFLNRKRCCCKR
ncbi:uncharacterized protein EI97DRAFT_438031 [Westerdykella ornata]|uniref:Invertebrate defensins family profile domain-containing protein n=1 Tax=Westerdykella ornata TaxID=318751 RepID=A0A6A6J534_WESOR|nr:uncharacterized protein EI97DRAFT_438031 [Westerdykella ornata]KAF2271233.1 hypothetical protein EI97DRAFT_438031 [Westerdykella ornata]